MCFRYVNDIINSRNEYLIEKGLFVGFRFEDRFKIVD